MPQMEPSSRIFVLATIGLSIAVWNVAFNLGAYQTIFFEQIFTVWVISMALLLALLVLPTGQRPVGSSGLFALASPTVWMISEFVSQRYGATNLLEIIVLIIAAIVLFVNLPYAAYIIISVTQSETLAIKPRRLLWSMIGIALLIGVVGYLIGSNNFLVLSCQDFQISGNDLPANCFVPQ